MAEHASHAVKAAKIRRTRPATVRTFSVTLLSPRSDGGKRPTWSFIRLPKEASRELPSRGQNTVQGTINAASFVGVAEPDGAGGHWLKIDRRLRTAAGAEPGDEVVVSIRPVEREPEPKMPADFRHGLSAASPAARATWADITPTARRDWIHWMTSGKLAATRTKRIATACDMLAKGKRRPCCFDRSGIYGKNLSCPEAAE